MRVLSTFVTTAALVASTAIAAGAQGSSAIGPFVSYTSGHGITSPVTAGAGITLFAGALGVRGSGAILLDDRGHLDASAPHGWDTDADLVLRLGRPGWQSFSLVPYAFTGIGGRSRPNAITGVNDFYHSWSYGGGIALGLSHSIQITGEARQRAMRAIGETQWHSTGGAEVRFGVMLAP